MIDQNYSLYDRVIVLLLFNDYEVDYNVDVDYDEIEKFSSS